MPVAPPQFSADKPDGTNRTFTWRQFARNDPNAPEYRARMLQAMLKLVPYTMGANALNALVLSWAFADDVGLIVGALWLMLVSLQIVHAPGVAFSSSPNAVPRRDQSGERRCSPCCKG